MKKTGVLIAVSALILCVLFLTLAGCRASKAETETLKLRIAEQYGLAYAPLRIVKELELIEKNLPGVEVTWRQLGNTAAIREAMLAGELDAGFMAIPPFLIGWDKGMDWKIACGLSTSPVGLVTNRANIQSLEDITPADRIVLPQPGSVQHILLSMACEKLWGDSTKLDGQLVTMAHPDGLNALLAKREVSAHFTTPPYLSKELKTPGMHEILNGREAMGEEFTLIVGAATAELYNEHPEVYQAFLQALEEAISFMEQNPKDTTAMLAEAYRLDQSEAAHYLESPDMGYSLEVKGVMRFAEFMEKSGYISRKPSALAEVLWDNNR